MKLLSPAGNLESLKMAIFNGADEVYLGINEFNARNNIDGFTLDTLESAVDFAHLYGVKVHLAINILFTDQELQDAVNTLVKAYNIGVDAFIVQDLALADVISKNYPEIELHASTQMGIHNLEGVKAIEKFGFKRVVLARETPLEEIKRIRDNSNIEIEYFAHGALCVSFSGNCYLSSYLNQASGNRGRCKQLCRLPYQLISNGKVIKKGYLLSAKDFQMVDRINDLKKAGVDAIKIEGRARRPYYVAAATSEYRKVLDGGKADKERLKLAFNRGFIEGYFNGNGDIISNVQSHVGIAVGKVIKVNGGKTFNEIILTANRKLNPKSTFKFFDGEVERAVVTAFDLSEISNSKYRITTTAKIKVGDNVRLISDYREESQTLAATKRVKVKVTIFGAVNEPLVAKAEYNGVTVEKCGDVLTAAQKQPLDKSEVLSCFDKSEYFRPQIDFNVKGEVFVRKSQLNELRRELYTALYGAVTGLNKKNISPIILEKRVAKKRDFDFQIVESVGEEFVKKNVIFSPETYSVDSVLEFVNKCKNQNKNGYLDTPNFALEGDVKLLNKIIEKTGVKIVANNYYALSLKGEKIIGAGLNVYNSYNAALQGRTVICAESDVGERIDFPFMTMRHCPLKSHDGSSCAKCTFNNDIKLKMESGKVMRLKRKKLCSCTFYLTD